MNASLISMFVALYLASVFADISTKSVGNNEFSDDENRQYVNEMEPSSTSGSQNAANHFTDALPGDPQLDYPTYTGIPLTGFSCEGKVNWHYYADTDAECQIFHVCETEHSKMSFFCPVGTIFNQRHLVCDWWYNFDCQDATELYALDHVYDQSQLAIETQEFDDSNGFDLSLASSGGNSDPSSAHKQSEHSLSEDVKEPPENIKKNDHRREKTSA